jgi:hypothetical protein
MMKNLDTKKQIKETDCLIIDEISMISRATLEKVEFLCTKVRNNDFAFGKIQVIESGDFFPACTSSQCFVWGFWT